MPRARLRIRTCHGVAAALALAVLAPGCAAPDEQPAIVFFVMDSVRADATGLADPDIASTPVLSSLARDALVYTNAYAPAPWTLPSHATLFTGAMPSEHGVGAVTVHAPDELTMLAEQLAAGGYQTLGISENVWIGPNFGMTQGFEAFETVAPHGSHAAFESALDSLLARRDDERPLFLFVNVMDAHEPYRRRGDEPFLDPATDDAVAREAGRTYATAFCRDDVPESTWSILWRLYLGGVRRAGV